MDRRTKASWHTIAEEDSGWLLQQGEVTEDGSTGAYEVL